MKLDSHDERAHECAKNQHFEIVLPDRYFTAFDPLWDESTGQLDSTALVGKKWFSLDHLSLFDVRVAAPKHTFTRGDQVYVKKAVFLRLPPETEGRPSSAQGLVRRFLGDEEVSRVRTLHGVWRAMLATPRLSDMSRKVRSGTIGSLYIACGPKGELFAAALTQQAADMCAPTRASLLLRWVYFSSFALGIGIWASLISLSFDIFAGANIFQKLLGILVVSALWWVIFGASYLHIARAWLYHGSHLGICNYSEVLEAEARLLELAETAMEAGWQEVAREDWYAKPVRPLSLGGSSAGEDGGPGFLDEVDPTWRPKELWAEQLPYPHPLHRLYRSLRVEKSPTIAQRLRGQELNSIARKSSTMPFEAKCAALDQEVKNLVECEGLSVARIQEAGLSRWFIRTEGATAHHGGAAVVLSVSTNSHNGFSASVALKNDPMLRQYPVFGPSLLSLIVVFFSLMVFLVIDLLGGTTVLRSLAPFLGVSASVIIAVTIIAGFVKLGSSMMARWNGKNRADFESAEKFRQKLEERLTAWANE